MDPNNIQYQQLLAMLASFQNKLSPPGAMNLNSVSCFAALQRAPLKQAVFVDNNSSPAPAPAPVSPSLHSQRASIDRVMNNYPSPSFFDDQRSQLTSSSNWFAPQQQATLDQLSLKHVSSPLQQPYVQQQPLLQQQPTFSFQPSMYDTISQGNIYGSQSSPYQTNVSYNDQAFSLYTTPIAQQQPSTCLSAPVGSAIWAQNVIISDTSLDILSKLLLIEELNVQTKQQHIRMQELKLEQQELRERKLPEIVEIPDEEGEEEDGGDASGDDENSDEEYVPEGTRRGSVQGASNVRRDSTPFATFYSSPVSQSSSPIASPNRRCSNAGNTPSAPSSAPSTPRRRPTPPQTPRRPVAASSVPIVVKQQTGNVEYPYLLVRGARKSSWERLENMVDGLNSKPYKYCLRLILPYKQETRSASPYYRIQAEDIALRIVHFDNSEIQAVEDGITLEKVVKTSTTPNGKEIELRVCFHCYSHGFNRQGFCIEVIDTCENMVLMRSGEFKIFARRKRTAGGPNGSAASRSGKKRKTTHPGK